MKARSATKKKPVDVLAVAQAMGQMIVVIAGNPRTIANQLRKGGAHHADKSFRQVGDGTVQVDQFTMGGTIVNLVR